MSQTTPTPEAAAAPSIPPDGSHPRRWAVLAVAGVAQFMVVLDATVVNVALPAIQRDLTASTSSLQWTVDAYVLFFGSMLLLGGRAADKLGRRRVFLAGLALFTFASLACGLGSSPAELITARAVQGAGAAMLSPAAMSTIVTVFRDAVERRTAMTVWSGLGIVGGTFGVLLGGALVSFADWRWAFWINIPIGVVTAVCALRFVPVLRPAKGSSGRFFDFPGAALSVASLAALIYAFVGTGESSWTSARTLGALGAAVLLLLALAVVERRSADPLIPPRIVAVGAVAASGLGLLLVSAVMMSMFFMTSVFQQQVLGYGPLRAACGMVGMGLPPLLMSLALPRLMRRAGPQRIYPFGGALLLAGGLLLTRLPGRETDYFLHLLPGMALIGFGLPMCFVTLTTMGVAKVAPAESGIVSSVLTMFNQTGAALGMATVVTAATARTAARHAEGQAMSQALTSGFHLGFLLVACVGAASLLLGLGRLRTGRRPAGTH
jgi:EmrB/QacA subfamily drug resistance transporter